MKEILEISLDGTFPASVSGGIPGGISEKKYFFVLEHDTVKAVISTPGWHNWATLQQLDVPSRHSDARIRHSLLNVKFIPNDGQFVWFCAPRIEISIDPGRQFVEIPPDI